MTSVITRTCQVRRGLLNLSCSAEATGVCQYCGRLFCSRHGVHLDEGQEVCSRRFCVAKRDDLARHLVYKAFVFTQNDQGLCGVEGCGSGIGGSCARCKGFFCNRHVHPRDDPMLENGVRVPRMATLCRHCAVRRPIWLRV